VPDQSVALVDPALPKPAPAIERDLIGVGNVDALEPNYLAADHNGVDICYRSSSGQMVVRTRKRSMRRPLQLWFERWFAACLSSRACGSQGAVETGSADQRTRLPLPNFASATKLRRASIGLLAYWFRSGSAPAAHGGTWKLTAAG